MLTVSLFLAVAASFVAANVPVATECNQSIDLKNLQPYTLNGTYTAGQNCVVKFAIPDDYYITIAFSKYGSGSSTTTVTNSIGDVAEILDNYNSTTMAFPANKALINVNVTSGGMDLNAIVNIYPLPSNKNAIKQTTSSGAQGIVLWPTVAQVYTFMSTTHVALNVIQSSLAGTLDLMSCFVFFGGSTAGTLLGTLYTTKDSLFVSNGSAITIYAGVSLPLNTYVLVNDYENVRTFSNVKADALGLPATAQKFTLDASKGPATYTFVNTDASNPAVLNKISLWESDAQVKLFAGTPVVNGSTLTLLATYTENSDALPQLVNQNVLTFQLDKGLAQLSFGAYSDRSWTQVHQQQHGFLATNQFPFMSSGQNLCAQFTSTASNTKYTIKMTYDLQTSPASNQTLPMIITDSSGGNTTYELGKDLVMGRQVAIVAQNITIQIPSRSLVTSGAYFEYTVTSSSAGICGLLTLLTALVMKM